MHLRETREWGAIRLNRCRFVSAMATLRLEARRECEHSPDAIRLMACLVSPQKESVMIKLGKVSVETRGDKSFPPGEIDGAPFTNW
jgi:hypothetical protein